MPRNSCCLLDRCFHALQLVGSLSVGSTDLFNLTMTEALAILACNLRTLQLQNNNLSGTIPYTVGDMAQLRTWDLGYNQISGTCVVSIDIFIHEGCSMTSSLASRCDDLFTVFVFPDAVSICHRSLPSVFGDINSLQVFVMTNNRLTGEGCPSCPLPGWCGSIPVT